MTELPEVKTVAKARGMSLVKWRKIHELASVLFNEIDSSCGFCQLGRYRAKGKGLTYVAKCDHCGVEKRCQKIMTEAGKLEEKLFELIDETITFLQDMDVTEK